jgi:hypothetical protein
MMMMMMPIYGLARPQKIKIKIEKKEKKDASASVYKNTKTESCGHSV